MAPAARFPPRAPAAPTGTPQRTPPRRRSAGGAARSARAGPEGLRDPGCEASALTARPTPTRARPAPRARSAYRAAGCPVRPALGSAPPGCAAAKDRPASSRAPGALLKPQSPPLPPPPLRIPPGRGRGLPCDGRAPAPIPSPQHLATRRGLARLGRSPSAPSQSEKDGTPPPASPTSHPPPLCPGRAGVRGVLPEPRLARRASAGEAWLGKATG